MDEDMRAYRRHLVSAEQNAQEDFDKTVLALSGGALGVSFAFVRDIVGSDIMELQWALAASWVSWGFSVTAVLFSYFFSHLALRKAISQVDNGEIRRRKPGGIYDKVTALLNGAGAVLFMAGVVFMIVFAIANLGGG